MRDLTILGLGGVGSAVAYHATRRGLDTVGLDLGSPGHVRAASTAPWRGFRATYFRDDRYVRLAQVSLALWRELESEIGSDLFDETGALLVAEEAHPVLASIEACARRHELPVDRWSREELAERTPIRTPPGFRAVLERGAGLLRATACNEAHLELARRAGLSTHAPCSIRSARPESGGWTLETDAGAIRTRSIVVAAGAGSPALLAQLGHDGALPFTLEHHAEQWFEPAGPGFDTMPPFNVIPGPGRRSFHGHPAVAGRGMMIARHRDGPAVDSAADLRLRTEDEAEVRAFAEAFLEGFGPTPRSLGRAHLYCNLPDDDFAVGPLGPGLLLATGLCGHGYKFASALGLGIVEQLLDEPGEVDLGAFDPLRFRQP